MKKLVPHGGKHILGTIKRKWGYYYKDLRGLEKVNGEMSLIMTVYNFKRVMNIFKFEELLQKLKDWNPDYERIIRSFLKLDFISSKIKPSDFHFQLMMVNPELRIRAYSNLLCCRDSQIYAIANT